MAINNQANVNYSFLGARAPINEDSNITTTSILSATSISIVKYPLGNTFIQGDNTSFIVRIENTGSTVIDNVALTDNLGLITSETTPIRLMDYVEGTASFSLNNSQWSEIVPTQDEPLTFAIGTLQAGDVYEIAYTARVISGTGVNEITNTATVSGNFGELQVSEFATSTLTEASYARLNIVKSQTSENAILGEDFSYTITLQNTGNLEATDVNLQDVLPDEFTLESVEMTQNGTTTTLDSTDYTYENDTLTIPSATSTLVLSVPAGDTLTFTLSGRFTTTETPGTNI